MYQAGQHWFFGRPADLPGAEREDYLSHRLVAEGYLVAQSSIIPWICLGAPAVHAMYSMYCAWYGRITYGISEIYG